MSRPTTRLSVIDILRSIIQPEFPDLVLVETTAQTIKSGVGAIQIFGGVKKPE